MNECIRILLELHCLNITDTNGQKVFFSSYCFNLVELNNDLTDILLTNGTRLG